MALQSQLFRGDPKIEAAAESDPAHVLPGARGPHVVKIQQALIQLDGAALSPDGIYGQGTAAAVAAFKQKRQILNVQGQIDNIVGKKTVAALDSEMAAKDRRGGALGGGAGGGRAGFGIVGSDPAQTNRAKPRDIIVQFAGALGAAEGTRDKASADDFVKRFNTLAYLQTHESVMPICFFGGRGSNDRSKDAVAEVLSVRGATPNGVTIILGESSGGLPALRAATALTGLSITLDYIGISDAAFFEIGGEVKFIPRRFSQPADIQIEMPGTIKANKSDNFFQTFGHNSLHDPRSANGFMPGTEFHGPLGNGFNDVDMMPRSLRLQALQLAFNTSRAEFSLPLFARKRLFADPAHVAGGRAGEAEAARVVATLIRP